MSILSRHSRRRLCTHLSAYAFARRARGGILTDMTPSDRRTSSNAAVNLESRSRTTVVVDTREKYGWKFANRMVSTERRALPAGDYGVLVEGWVVAVVERKSLANLATSLSDGSLACQMQRLAESGRASVVVEVTTLISSGRSQVAAPGWPTCWAGSRCGTRRCRSSSPARGSSPKSGPTGSSVRRSATRARRRRHQRAVMKGGDRTFETPQVPGRARRPRHCAGKRRSIRSQFEVELQRLLPDGAGLAS
jgi:hypothetical protein